MREGFEGLIALESFLVQFLQTITPLVDTKERAVLDAIAELRTVTGIAQRAAASTQRQVERFASELGRGGTDAATRPEPPPLGRGRAAKYGMSRMLTSTSVSRIGSGALKTEIRARLTFYVPYFAGAADVLDIGCGRGEFLELLREHGITARGST